MNIRPRKTAPTATASWDDVLAFRVWSQNKAYEEDPAPWKCVAAFQFLGDALEYIAELQDNGVDCVFQSPAHTSPVLHTENRVVWRPQPETAVA